MDSIFNGWNLLIFSPKGWKKVTLSETLAGISTLPQWTVQRAGETTYSKCPLNEDIICILALEEQETLPLAFMD